MRPRDERPACFICGKYHGAPRHLSDRHEDTCSLVCAAAFKGGVINCSEYIGTHRAEPTS